MVHKVEKYICKNHLLTPGSKVLVALSGGADSVALLVVLIKLGYNCEAIHCNFHLRSEESDRDEQFVRQLCNKKGIKLTIVHFDTTAYAKENTIVINGVSKAYAMTGWRIGYLAAAEWIVKGCNKLQGQYTSGPCSVSQMASLEAYTGSQEPVEEMRKAFQRRRDLIVKLAKEIPGLEVNIPEGAFYLFPKCSSFYGKSYNGTVIKNSDDLAMYLLTEAHVAAVGGTSFGAPECFRMSYATSDENIIEAIRRIKEALAKLA